ncbi:MAG: FtsK/SpoIIIE domain-containing protein, partial [Ktedonobacterales bacterium]
LQGGPLLVMGDLNAGKTTALQTLLLYLALNYSPADLRWHVLDPTGAFEEFAALPHAVDYRDPTARTVLEGDEKDFAGFKARFEQTMEIPLALGRPALLLVIVYYDELASRYGAATRAQLHDLTQKVIRGRKEDVYLALSAARQGFETLPAPILSGMTTKIALYMSNRDALSAILGTRLPFAPDPLPGRGFAQTRVSLDEIQIASPVSGANDVERAENLHLALQQANVRVRA